MRVSWWRRVRFRDVLILTAPIVIVWAAIFTTAVLDFRTLSQFGDFFAQAASLNGAVATRIRVALAYPRVAAVADSLGAEAPDAAIVRLRFSDVTWRHLQGDPLRYPTAWLDADLIRGNAMQGVRVRRRGDNSIHWTTPKRSFTLRTARDELFKTHRSLAFSGKDVLTQYVASRLAAEFDLLAPRMSLAPVFVNDRFYGVFRVVELGDDLFLRRHGRALGNIFRGDAAERDEVFRGVERNLFLNPYIWERESIVDHAPGAGAAALVSFLTDLNGTTFEEHQRAMRRVDRDEIARLFAYLLVVGDPYHMDDLHNQIWYEDPATGLMHPIPWDVRLLEMRGRPHWINRFGVVMLRDPFLVDHILRTVHDRNRNDRLLRSVERTTLDAERRFGTYLRHDRLRGALIPPIGTADEAMTLVRGNLELLEHWTRDARVAFHATAPGGMHPAVLDLETRGYAGADLVALRVRGVGAVTPSRGPSRRLTLDRNQNGVLDGDDPVVETTWEPAPDGGRLVLRSPEPILPGWRVENLEGTGIIPGSVHYRFFLSGLSLPSSAVLSPELRNRVTDAPASVIAWSAGSAVTAGTSFSPWRYPAPRGVTRRLAGAVTLRETMRISASDTLALAPGTTLCLAPGVSIIVRGHLAARGTATRPITFTALARDSAWGTLALQGSGASGSRLEHVRLERGRGAVVDGIAYGGMLSVHAAQDVRLAHARVTENLGGNAAVRALSAAIAVEDSRFSDTHGAALELVHASGMVARNVFERADGSAIALSMSSPVVVGNRITGASGSGISVGERSDPVIVRNEVSESAHGIDVRDDSEPLIALTTLRGNEVGLRQRALNWQYGGGGWAKLARTVFADNAVDLVSDDRSRLTIAGDARADSVVGAGALLLASVPDGVARTGPLADATPWLLAQRGVHAGDAHPTEPTRWTAVASEDAIAADAFADDFGEMTNGWRSTGGVSRLEKERGTLAMSLRKERGAIGLPVEWDLRETGGGALVLEIAARDVLRPTVTLVSDRGRVTHALPPAVDLKSFRYVTIPLPPARYRAVIIEATPRPDAVQVEQRTGFLDLKTGRVELRSYRAFGEPAPGRATSASAAP